jgi:protein TonB
MTKITSEKRLALKAMSFGLIGSLLNGCGTPIVVLDVERSVEPDNTKKRPTPSQAKSFKDYRYDAAKHLYLSNAHQIYSGKLPPLLYAVGVLRIDIAANGDLKAIDWMRKPLHAPEVIAEIEKKIQFASPFPAAMHLGDITYTETWLWHKSGRFQLDTLTEGQI